MNICLIPKSLRSAYLKMSHESIIIEEAEIRIRAILNCEEQSKDIIIFCKEYSYTLTTPNIENFKCMFDRIYLKIVSGELWEEIKEDIQETNN